MTLLTTEIPQAKKETVKEFAKLINEYPIVGALNLEGLPARQLQTMREKLRDSCVIKMTKRRLMKVAFEDSKKEGIADLEGHLKGMPALLFTNENPFTLFKMLKKNKSPAPAKAGQEAPKDIIVPAGPTPFAPGPIIGELGKFGLKTGVENGKVAVKEAKQVAAEGDIISDGLAQLLTKLQIYPMEVGLDLTAVHEGGMIITKKVLDVDEDQYMSDLLTAASMAVNLSVNASVFNAVSTPIILATASQKATSLSVETGYVTGETAGLFISKAQAQLFALASHLPDEALSDELRGAAANTAAPVQTAQSDTPSADDKKEDEKPDEDQGGDMAAGLGALFG